MLAWASLYISRRWPERSFEEARRICHQSPQAKEKWNHSEEAQADQLCSHALTRKSLRRDKRRSYWLACALAEESRKDFRRTNQCSKLFDFASCDSTERSTPIWACLQHPQDNWELPAYQYWARLIFDTSLWKWNADKCVAGNIRDSKRGSLWRRNSRGSYTLLEPKNESGCDKYNPSSVNILLRKAGRTFNFAQKAAKQRALKLPRLRVPELYRDLRAKKTKDASIYATA